VHLPKEFAPVEALLEEMPWVKRDGKPGLLQQYKFGEASKKVPDLTHVVKDIQDTGILNALFRDYTFWASSYLLEPCHHNMIKAGDSSSFGLGRDTLPVNIAGPLIAVANKIGAKPFMEYAQSYA
jgi:indoleamine 2,3-dioxygenase